MNSMSSVVDQMTRELSERRHAASARRAAYLSLARAIVTDQEPLLLVQPAADGQPTAITAGARPTQAA